MEQNNLKEILEEKQEKELSLREIYDFFAFNWKWFVLSLIFFLGLGYVTYKVLPRKYVASAMIYVDPEYSRSINSDITNFSPLRNMYRYGGGGVDNEVFIIRSRSLMENVVRKLDANVRYYQQAKLREVEVSQYYMPLRVASDSVARGYNISLDFNEDGYNAILRYSIGKKRFEEKFSSQYGEQIDHEDVGKFTITRTDKFDDFVEQYGKSIRVTVSKPVNTAVFYSNELSIGAASKTASVLNLSLVDHVSIKAAEIINSLIDVYNDDAVEGKRETARATMFFLNDRLMRVSIELDSIDTEISNFKQRHGSIDIHSESNIFLNSVTKYQDEQVNVAVQIDLVQSVSNYLDAESYSLLPVDLGIEDSGLTTGFIRYNDLILDRMRKTNADPNINNPLIRELDAQIHSMRQSLKESLANLLKSLKTKHSSLEKQIQTLLNKVDNIPAFEKESISIMRNQEIKSTLYSFLLNKREETGLQLVATAPIAKIVDPALPSERPVSPKGSIVMIVFFLLGLLVPALTIFLIEQLRIKVGKISEIEETLNVPIIGAIPSKPNNDDDDRIVGPNSRDVISEAFRMVRTNLGFTMPTDGKVIMTTSAMPGEGKSFVSINLALSLAITGKKVILMDLDLRKSTLADRLSNKKQLKGLVNYLAGKTDDLKELIVPDMTGSVDLLFVGVIPPNPAELILGERMGEVFDKLKEQYDYIVVDTPPVGLVTDSVLLSKYSDVTIFAVRIGHSHKRNLPAINMFSERKLLKNINIIITDTGASKGYSKYGSYSVAYGYGAYGYGYGVEQEAKGIMARTRRYWRKLWRKNRKTN